MLSLSPSPRQQLENEVLHWKMNACVPMHLNVYLWWRHRLSAFSVSDAQAC